jgi:hypothetical protein
MSQGDNWPKNNPISKDPQRKKNLTDDGNLPNNPTPFSSTIG